VRNALEILRFELAEQARRPANYVFVAVLFGLSLAITGFYGSRFQGLLGNPVPTFANSPHVVVMATRMLAMLGLLGMAGSVFARAATKDYELDDVGPLVTTGLREWEFVLGRLSASWLTALLVLLAVPLGQLCGLMLPVNLPEHVGAFSARTYLHAFVWHVLPQVLVAGTLLFAFALVVRRSLLMYLASFLVVVVPGLLVAPLGAIGLTAARDLIRLNNAPDMEISSAWVPAERNVQALPVPGDLIVNRVLWLGVAAAVLYLLARRFQFTQGALQLESLPGLRGFAARRARAGAMAPQAVPAGADDRVAAGRGAAPARTGAPVVEVKATLGARLRQWRARTWLEFRWLAGTKSFWVALAIGIGFSVMVGLKGGEMVYDAALYPTTANLLSRATFVWVLLLFLAVMAGESLWRERDCRIDSLVDVTPAPNWVFFSGLLSAIVAIQALAFLLFTAIAVAVQAWMGVSRVDVWPFLWHLLSIRLVQVSILVVPVLLIHVLANSKYVGHLLTLLYFAAFVMFPGFLEGTLGLPKLAVYGAMPEPLYSDMNGFGNLVALRWFELYWGLVAVVLLVFVQLLWVRGTEAGVRTRWRLAVRELAGPRRLVLASVVGLAVLSGGWIAYATKVLYRSPEQLKAAEFGDLKDKAAQRPAIEAYLKKYRHLESRHPDLAHVAMKVDVQPGLGRLQARTVYEFENRGSEPLTEILLTEPAALPLDEFDVDGTPVTPEMERVSGARVRHFTLAQPLAPGARVKVGFSHLRTPPGGFSAGDPERAWVANGLYVLSTTWLPRVGFVGFLEDGLREADTPESKDDAPEGGRQLSAVQDGEAEIPGETAPSRDLRRWATGTWQHRATFEGTICTDPDQTALLPGALERAWDENGRRCFAYRSDVPQHFQFHVISGRYAVRREQHGAVTLEVYHHPDHAFNVDAILSGMRTSLDINSASLGPYPLSFYRICEVPYLGAAITSPGTAVYGEPFGMMARVDREQPGVVDLPFFVAAHEAAHQWWGEQVVPARAPGYSVLMETLTQYAATIAIERAYGPESVRSFLGYEAQRYLQTRAQGSDVPLAKATNQQHVFYRKGAIVMHALRDALGPDALDGALSRFFKEYRNGPPFPLSSDLMAALQSAAPENQHQIITDLLETITFWYLQTERATWAMRPDKKYEVTLEYKASKVRSDNAGTETPLEMGSEMIDVGVLDSKGS
jgi:hypothetical protein